MVTRITGLSSGMDIDGLVTQLMTAEKAPLNKLEQKKQTLTWKTDAYRNINTSISAFRSAYSSLRFASSWTQTAATSTDSTKVTVSTGSTASTGTHNIVVNSLAKAGNLFSSAQISASDLSSSATPTGIDINAADNNNEFSLTLGSVTKMITVADGSYDSVTIQKALQTAIDNAFGVNQIKVDTSSGNISLTPLGATGYEPQLIIKSVSGNDGLANLGFTNGQAYKFDANATLSSQAAKLATGSIVAGSFTINGQTFSIDPSRDTLNSIISQVNNSAAGVKMAYDSTTDRLTITTKSTGENAVIDITEDSTQPTGFLQAFGLNKVSDGKGGYTNYSAGTSATVTIDGVPGKYSTNSFASNGVTYNLQNVTDANGVNVSVNTDTDGIYKQVEDFVNKYNSLLTSINSLLNEATYRDYQPLTSDQKADMKDSDITLWEAKAKSGLLHNDSMLKTFRDTMRETVYSSVSGIPSGKNALYLIGVTTEKLTVGDTTNAGKLTIDSTKLKAAIEEDPQSVINLLTNQSLNDNNNEKGVFQRLYEAADTVISNISKAAGSTSNSYDNVSFSLGKQVHDIEADIDGLQVKLNTKEDNYYSMFSKMETAISNSNSQLSALSSFLS